MVDVQKPLIIARYHIQNRSKIMFCCSTSLCLGDGGRVLWVSNEPYRSYCSCAEGSGDSEGFRLSVQELSWPRLLHFFDLTCVSVRLCVSEHQLHGFTCHVWEFHLSGAGRIVGILRPRLRKSAELTDLSSAVGGNACVSGFYADLVAVIQQLIHLSTTVMNEKIQTYMKTVQTHSLFCRFSQVCSRREGVCGGRGVPYGPVLAVSVSRWSVVLFQSRMCQAGLRELLRSWRRMLPRLYRYWTSSVQLELDLSRHVTEMMILRTSSTTYCLFCAFWVNVVRFIFIISIALYFKGPE